MKLKSFGCSHIFGSDLNDQFERYPSLRTWPALMARNLGLDYQCFAWPGRGNLYIAEQVVEHAAQEPALFVINWTYVDRFDYNNADDNTWQTCRPGEADPASEEYYRRLHSEYRDKLTTLMQIKLCIDLLDQSHQPFVMTYMDELMFDKTWHTSPAIAALQQSIAPRMTTFNGQNFVQYAQAAGHPLTPQAHLLYSGHAAAADYIIAWYKQNTNGPAQLALS